MKEYLNKFTVITLACNKNGKIIEKNVAAEKVTWLPKTGKIFTSLNKMSNPDAMLCQTHYLQKTNQEQESSKFQIIPYNQGKKKVYLVFIFLESEFPKQKILTAPSEEVEDSWYPLKKAQYSAESRIPFSECYSLFLDVFKDTTFHSNITFEDTAIYGDKSLFQKIFKELKNIILMGDITRTPFTITATNNKDRKQIVLEIKLTQPFNRTKKKNLNIYTNNIQKNLESVQGIIRVETVKVKPVILFILNTKEQNINPLQILIIDSYEKSLKQMIEYVRMVDPFARTVAISDTSRVLSISKKQFSVIILDPHINRFKFFPYFFRRFNHELVNQITENQEKNIIICIVFYGKLLEQIVSSHFSIVDYHRKPYHFNKTKAKVQQVLQTARRMNTLNQDLEKAQYFSQIDKLTGLYNRRYFDTSISRLAQEALHKNFPFSLLILDVDFFKEYNDRNGHAMGDSLLKELAKIIEYSVRSTDITARFGGEEFVILAPKVQEDIGFLIAEKIRKKVEMYEFQHQNKQPNKTLTISVGVASFPKDASNITDLFAIADKNLYQAKKNGKNQTITSKRKKKQKTT